MKRLTLKLKRLLDGSDKGGAFEATRAAEGEQTFHPDTKLVILSAEAKAEIMHVLDKLAKFPMTVELLGKTTIAKQLQEMKKHPEADLPLVVRPIVKAWKAMFKE